MTGMDEQTARSKLAALRHNFLAGVPERLAQMQAHWRGHDVTALRREAHNLAGAAATYLCPELADAARTLEKAALAVTSPDTSDPHYRRTVDALQRLAATVATLGDGIPAP